MCGPPRKKIPRHLVDEKLDRNHIHRLRAGGPHFYMEIVTSNCPGCGAELELPLSFDNVICRRCGAAYRASHHKNAVHLHRIDRFADSEEAELAAELDSAIVEIDEQIANIKEEIETIRSREQGASLQLGCAVFGAFGAVIIVLAIFVTVGRGYFGGVLFYSALAAVLIMAGMRLKTKLLTRPQKEMLRHERRDMEQALAALASDRERLAGLRVEE